ncbi:MAG: Glutathione S-transferase GST-6.0 [Hyphomicrobiaceae bacterium hypho_1]
MMQFYMAPGSCSTGIHLLLEELDLIFEVKVVDLTKGDHLTAEFRAINPKCTIPVLVLEGGEALTDFTSIAWWLAIRHPKKRLIPRNPLNQVRALEWVNYVTHFIHGQGFTRIFTTDKYLVNDGDEDAIKSRGRELVSQGFSVVEQHLSQNGNSGYIFGQFSIADAAIFYVEFWAEHLGIPLPINCRRHFELMCHRPVVRRVLYEEGYRLPSVFT